MDSYIQFIGAVLVLLIMPGPDMAYCMACGMPKGIKGAFFAASGIGIGIGGLFSRSPQHLLCISQIV